MRKLFPLLLCLCSFAALAQDPPYIYKQYGFVPKQYKAGPLTETQKAELDECVSAARAMQKYAKSNPRAAGDLFGVSISECLTAEGTGKGWQALEKTADGWKPVLTLDVMRDFMGLD
ncbi:MAG: hypothetical protein LBB55_04390 [Zoogloeaceae bacterium]|jgi:hypothetical protein|nr:hypothetical protein [Zoogloeaceae bacterium]